MGASIDLEELAVRESEQVEWKENVADADDVVATLSAFANDLPNLGGGYVVCGVTEAKDEHGFPRLVRSGLTADRLKEVEGVVTTRCRERVDPPLTPRVEELPSAGSDRRILVFIQPATQQAHLFRRRDDAGKYFVRVSRETREARNGVLRDLLVRKGALEPWDRRPCATATEADLDLLALRDALQRMAVFASERGVEAYLSEEFQLSPFVPSLCARDPLTGVLRPRNFALLLFGRQTQRFVPGAFSLFSVYAGLDRSEPHAERHEIAGTLLDQARRLGELLDAESYTAFDKTDATSPNATKYPKRALYEAMGNALAHRDYELPDPTRITVFGNRVEFFSPGSLPPGVDPAAFREGKAGPKWRNQALAWFLNRLQLAQAEGQGIPTILRAMKQEGCPPPTLQASEAHVLCILGAHPRHAVLRDLREAEKALALGELGRAQALVRSVLERDALSFRGVQLFAEVQQALRNPGPLFDFLTGLGDRILVLPPAALIQAAEALSSERDTPRLHSELARRLLEAATRARLDEGEVRRVAVSLDRSGDPKGALDLLERHWAAHPESGSSPLLLQVKGNALIGLAKRCRITGRDRSLPRRTRERAWKEFQSYLDQAEQVLRSARELSLEQGLSDLVDQNLGYLGRLRAQNSKPRSEG
ncbi:MAG: putative DNA binding domain-containing protein [Deltaproteobacteria bacterium]|nr:putative DNA binding domain-containing protein [Deltaproteobacteria bacterium]